MLSNFQGVRKDKRVRLASFSPPGRRCRQADEGEDAGRAAYGFTKIAS